MPIDKKKLKGAEYVFPLKVEPYEQYMSASENPSVVAKINAIVQSLHQIGRLNNEVVKQWNTVMDWIVNGGVEEYTLEFTTKKMEEMLSSGLFEEILTDSISSLNEKIDKTLKVYSEEIKAKVDVSAYLLFKDELNAVLNQFNQHLAKKANDSEVRKKSVKLELEDMSPTAQSAITGGATIDLLSVPQDGSVSVEKMSLVTGLNMYPFHKKAILNENLETSELIFKSFKDISLYGANPLSEYYISYIRKAHNSLNKFYWSIVVSEVSVGEVARFHFTSDAKTGDFIGTKKHTLSELNGSGISGEVTLNWDYLGEPSFNDVSLSYAETGLDIRTYSGGLFGFLTTDNKSWEV